MGCPCGDLSREWARGERCPRCGGPGRTTAARLAHALLHVATLARVWLDGPGPITRGVERRLLPEKCQASHHPAGSLVALTSALVLSAFLVFGCGLTPSQIGGLVRGGITFACSTASPFVPAARADLASTVCTDAIIGEKVIEGLIEGAASSSSSSAVRASSPALPTQVRCAGGVVAVVPAKVGAEVQRGLDARPECQR